MDEEGVGRALSCCPSVNTGGGTVVDAQEVVVCHPLLNAVPSAVLGLVQVPEAGVGVDIPSVKAVDAGREVVDDE